MGKSKAESFKETIMSALEDETEDEAIADASKAAAGIYGASSGIGSPVDSTGLRTPDRTGTVERTVRPQELGKLVEQALEGSGERFRLSFDDDSNLYLSTTGGILTATVSK